MEEEQTNKEKEEEKAREIDDLNLLLNLYGRPSPAK